MDISILQIFTVALGAVTAGLVVWGAPVQWLKRRCCAPPNVTSRSPARRRRSSGAMPFRPIR